MMPGMYNPHSIPHLPQLAQPNPMANTGMGFAQMGPQQAFATTNHGPGNKLHHDAMQVVVPILACAQSMDSVLCCKWCSRTCTSLLTSCLLKSKLDSGGDECKQEHVGLMMLAR